MAAWLNSAFHGIDGSVFGALHSLAENMGGFFTPLAKIISIIGEKGIIFFLLGLIFMLFSKTRKGGVCMFGALCIGAFITSVILKNSVARVRPYDASEEYFAFWKFVNGGESSSYCFPSGHTTMITAAAVAFFIFFNKKWSFVGFIAVLFMGFSRIYLVAHYFSDVLGGIIVGVISGVIAYFITKLIFFLLEKHKDKKFCKFCLDFDIKSAVCKKTAEPDKDDKAEKDQ